ncbi:hypothetical protein BS17DRAFT_842472 [Gyrodon lividus]|nr:hypothetical protein BS17DRAFT_842472 [Gyrodon lividus]
MSLVVIRVELPAYFYSFNIEVPETSTVLDVKQAISTACVGHPRPEGQRIVWRGRYLDDVEKICELWPSSDEQRVVHLSVRPSSWTGGPPNLSNGASSSSVVSALLVKETLPRVSSRQQASSSDPSLGSVPDNSLAFIHYKHWQALCFLSNFKLAPPNALEDITSKGVMARLTLERWGYTWPDILDATFPLADPASANGLDYEVVTIDGKCYLSLLTREGTPTPMQVHALKILTHTFSILSLPPPSPAPTSTILETSPAPPHVNDLLQQLGLPPLRALPNANIDVTVQPGVAGAPPVPEHGEANVIREIPIRALLAPLLMVVLRTIVVLYFFSPTRKPLLGLCIVAWIVYEMWTHVRIVILRPLGRAGRNGAGAGANGAQVVDDAFPAAPPVGQANGHGGGLNVPRPAEQNPNGQQARGPPIPSQSNGIIDSFALTNIHSENKLLWPMQQPPRLSEPPSLFHKATLFFSLMVVTLHPEVYNRRSAALRQREGRLRTEMNTMEQEPEAREEQPFSEEEQTRQEFRQQLQTQHARRVIWVRQYVDRVRRGDWMDE